MKITIRIISYVLVLAIGLAVGGYYGFGYGQGRAFTFDMIETAYYSVYTEMQMAEGTDAAREEALRGFLALTEKRKGHWNPLFTEKVYAIDSALANARLSALAQKRGADQEARQYLKLAASFCPQIGWQECSTEKIVSIAQHLDKQGKFREEGAE